jgi:hypothetical protein
LWLRGWQRKWVGIFAAKYLEYPVTAKVYLIEDPVQSATCPLRPQCTQAKKGRSLQQPDDHVLIVQAQKEAASPAGRNCRKRRQHIMEGSFADAANNHGSKRARWRTPLKTSAQLGKSPPRDRLNARFRPSANPASYRPSEPLGPA